MKKAPKQLNTKLSDEERDLLEVICQATGYSAQGLTHKLFEALFEQWKNQGYLVIPLKLADANEWQATGVIKGTISGKTPRKTPSK